jgi:hypothetical protein
VDCRSIERPLTDGACPFRRKDVCHLLVFNSSNFRRSYFPIRPQSRSRARPSEARRPSRRKASLPWMAVPDPASVQDPSPSPKGQSKIHQLTESPRNRAAASAFNILQKKWCWKRPDPVRPKPSWTEPIPCPSPLEGLGLPSFLIRRPCVSLRPSFLIHEASSVSTRLKRID